MCLTCLGFKSHWGRPTHCTVSWGLSWVNIAPLQANSIPNLSDNKSSLDMNANQYRSFCKVYLHLFARFKIVAASQPTMINTGTWQIRVWPVLGSQTMTSPARPQVKKRLPGMNQQKAAGVWLRDTKLGSNPWRQALLIHMTCGTTIFP